MTLEKNSVKGLWAVVKTQNGKHCIPVKIESIKLDKVTFYGWAFGERLHEYSRAAIMITCDTEEAANDYIKSICDENGVIIKESNENGAEDYSASSIESLNDYAAGLGDACKDLKPGDGIIVKGYYVERSDSGQTYYVWVDLDESKIVKESNSHLYLFPELTDEDIEMLKVYGLTYKGKNHGADGSENNWVVVGDASALRRYADKYLGYELHPDYLYDADDFAGEIVDNINEDAEKRKRISYRGYIIRPRKSDDGELYWDIIKPKWSTTEPIWDWCDSVEEAKEWIDSDKDEPFDESKSIKEGYCPHCGKQYAEDGRCYNQDCDAYDPISQYFDEPFEELNESSADLELTEDEKDDILFTVAMGFESGHHIYKDFEDFKSEFENISHAKAGWEYYCELVNLGPAGFYAEHKDDYIFDDSFIAEYGGEPEDEGPYLGKGKISMTAWNHYGPGELPYWSGKKFDAKELPELLKNFADKSRGSTPFEVLSVDGSEVSGWYVYDDANEKYVFTTNAPQELLNKLKDGSYYRDPITESSKPDKFNVIDTTDDSADDTREYTQAQMHDFCKELIEIEEESSEPKQYVNRPKLGYDLKSITAVLKHFGYEVKPVNKSVKETYSPLFSDRKVFTYANYYNAKAKADELGFIEAEYGDSFGREYSYCEWTKTGEPNKGDSIMAYYQFDENGKPKPLSKEDADEINSENELGGFEDYDTLVSDYEDLSDADNDTGMLEKMSGDVKESYDPFDVYSTYEIKNADTDEVIRKIHSTSMDPDDSSTWFDDDDIISQYAVDGIIITRYDYDQGMLDGSEVLYPEESEEIDESVVIETTSDESDEDLKEATDFKFEVNENFELRQQNGIIG